MATASRPSASSSATKASEIALKERLFGFIKAAVGVDAKPPGVIAHRGLHRVLDGTHLPGTSRSQYRFSPGNCLIQFGKDESPQRNCGPPISRDLFFRAGTGTCPAFSAAPPGRMTPCAPTASPMAYSPDRLLRPQVSTAIPPFMRWLLTENSKGPRRISTFQRK